MAGLSKRQQERLQQRAERSQEHAAHQVNIYAGQEPVPADDATPEAWAAYVNSARGRWATATIEWGNRIAQAHAAYKVEPQRWGRTWENWCREQLGVSHQGAYRLMAIAQNLSHAVRDILPGDQQALYALARLRQSAPAVFDAAVARGDITPQLTRDAAQQLLKLAQGGQTPAALPTAPPPFRRVAGLTLEAAQADKLEAIAQHRGTTPAQVAADVMQSWLKRQPMPEGTVTIDATAQAAE